VLLVRSRHLSFHARGEAVFVWHGLVGDVAEMSVDVMRLILAYDKPADPELVAAAGTAGLGSVDAHNFTELLRRRGFLVEEGTNEVARLLDHYPLVPRLAVYEKSGDEVVVYTRTGEVRLDAELSRFYLRSDGKRRLRDLLDERVARAPEFLRLCRADAAALKLLPEIDARPPWAESTMPFPEIDPYVPALPPLDLRRYHLEDIEGADEQFEERETTLSHLLRVAHPSLQGKTFGQALGDALLARGARREARVLEVGGGTGLVGVALRSALAARSYAVLDLAPALSRAQRSRGLEAVRADARRLPVRSGAVDIMIANEMAGDLGTEGGVNVGAVELVDEAARVLAPGGLLYLSEFGSPEGAPVLSSHLDHDEHSLRFSDLRAEAEAHGLTASVERLPVLLGMRGETEGLVTTRASFAALRRLFAAHGATLDKRAWTREAVESLAVAADLDLSRVHGLSWAPAGERMMGLRPFDFWALVAKKPYPQ
jgi:SAM-dependent methyltransferase